MVQSHLWYLDYAHTVPVYTCLLLYFLSRLCTHSTSLAPYSIRCHTYGFDYSKLPVYGGRTYITNDIKEEYLFIINVIEMWLESRPANSYERISLLP